MSVSLVADALEILAVDFHPDGQRIATGAVSLGLKIWSTTSLAEGKQPQVGCFYSWYLVLKQTVTVFSIAAAPKCHLPPQRRQLREV